MLRDLMQRGGSHRAAAHHSKVNLQEDEKKLKRLLEEVKALEQAEKQLLGTLPKCSPEELEEFKKAQHHHSKEEWALFEEACANWQAHLVDLESRYQSPSEKAQRYRDLAEQGAYLRARTQRPG